MTNSFLSVPGDSGATQEPLTPISDHLANTAQDTEGSGVLPDIAITSQQESTGSLLITSSLQTQLADIKRTLVADVKQVEKTMMSQARWIKTEVVRQVRV